MNSNNLPIILINQNGAQVNTLLKTKLQVKGFGEERMPTLDLCLINPYTEKTKINREKILNAPDTQPPPTQCSVNTAWEP